MLRIITTALVATSLIITPALFVSAETASSTSGSAIVELSQRILELRAKILELDRQKAELEVKQREATVELTRRLATGTQGEDVRALQILLALDQEVYPEGMITGFFGPLTAKAVMKFQKKNGIEQVGFVGPKTLKKLNEKLKESAVIIIGATTTASLPFGSGFLFSTSTPCLVVPPGHLIAPGFLKKHSDDDEDDDEDDDNDHRKKKKHRKGKWNTTQEGITIPCHLLPHGIAKKLIGATSTPRDVLAPTLSGISIGDIASTSVSVRFTANEPVIAWAKFGTTTSYGFETGWTLSATTTPTLSLSGLSASTTYHVRIKAKDQAGNRTESGDIAFTTP